MVCSVSSCICFGGEISTWSLAVEGERRGGETGEGKEGKGGEVMRGGRRGEGEGGRGLMDKKQCNGLHTAK